MSLLVEEVAEEEEEKEKEKDEWWESKEEEYVEEEGAFVLLHAPPIQNLGYQYPRIDKIIVAGRLGVRACHSNTFCIEPKVE